MKSPKILLAAASVIALAACGSAASTTAASSPRPALTPASTEGAPFTGVFETNALSSFSLVREFAAATGAHPQVVASYNGWWVPFNTALAGDEHAIGATPLVQIDPQGINVAWIASGRYDTYLRSFAAAVKTFGHPVILSFGHEMNGGWYGWGDGRTKPSVFISAWRHIVTVFRGEGAANVTWLWTVNAVNAASAPMRQWWPGAAYVNWVGMDGYYYYRSSTYQDVFGRTVAEIRTFTADPVLIAETGIAPNPDAAEQVTGLFDGIRADHLLGAVWFDQSEHKPPYHLAWRLETDPPALAAYRAAVKTP
jgi:mannan endo-1,4-beta-mannosidase